MAPVSSDQIVLEVCMDELGYVSKLLLMAVVNTPVTFLDFYLPNDPACRKG